MSITQMFKDSSKNLSKIAPLCVCSMMLALRIVLGMFTNFTLASWFCAKFQNHLSHILVTILVTISVAE